MSYISLPNFSSIDDDYNELSFSKEIDFKIEAETLDTQTFLNTYPNDIKFLWHIQSFMIYMIPKLQIQKRSNKGDMTKTPDLTQSLQKLITLTKHIFFFWKFENIIGLQSYIIFLSFIPRSFHSRSRSRFKDLTSTTFDMLISSHLFSFIFFFFTFFLFLISLLHLTNSYDIAKDFLTLDLFQLFHQIT